jgi:hypothetical protein
MAAELVWRANPLPAVCWDALAGPWLDEVTVAVAQPG